MTRRPRPRRRAAAAPVPAADAAGPPAGADAAASRGGVLAHCRAGFERECAGELLARAADAGIAAWCQAEPAAARVLCLPADPAALDVLARALPLPALVFSRERCVVGAELPELPERRAAALVQAAARTGSSYGELRIETADSDACRPLLPLCRALAGPLAQALRAAGVLHEVGGPARTRLHVHLFASRRARLGMSLPDEGSPWVMGIPRLRSPRGAPSRSALKLEEALRVLLPMLPRVAPPGPGMSAVDLGAAPGGWSLVLARREMQVTAIDNGSLTGAAATHAGIEHLRADGFRYRPPRPVHWLLCDMVESPSRITALVAGWLAQRWCAAALFNLKLPMNKRLQEVDRCREILLRDAGRPLDVVARQLYHDREEITVLAVPRTP